MNNHPPQHPKLELKITFLPNYYGARNLQQVKTPEYATSLSSGFDLVAAIGKPIQVEPGTVVKVPTGIKVSIPVGYELQIRSRSGMTFRHGLIVANAPGTIDADYCDHEIGLLMTVIGSEPSIMEPGMKVAQAVLCPVVQAKFVVVGADEMKEIQKDKDRKGGFGSTGTGVEKKEAVVTGISID